MSIQADKLRLIYYPDPRLRAKCKPVQRFDEDLAAIAGRMIEIMRAENGLGLAAPQVGLDVRMFVCMPGKDAQPVAYVNPELSFDGDDAMNEEGCLSLPDVHVNVRRSQRVVMHARDVNGNAVKVAAEGLTARVWQHETDHLDGRLIIDRMTEAEKMANRKLLRELERDYKGPRPAAKKK